MRLVMLFLGLRSMKQTQLAASGAGRHHSPLHRRSSGSQALPSPALQPGAQPKAKQKGCSILSVSGTRAEIRPVEEKPKTRSWDRYIQLYSTVQMFFSSCRCNPDRTLSMKGFSQESVHWFYHFSSVLHPPEHPRSERAFPAHSRDYQERQ